jgi:hypothetical protein
VATRCPRCDAELDGAPNYCTRCGYALELAPAPEPAPVATVDARFVACHACGATNAASRRHCGRCGAHLAGDGPAAAPEALLDTGELAGSPEEVESSSPVVFVLAVTLAAVAIIGVILTILSASGIGPFAPPPTPPREAEIVISSVRASSAEDAYPVDNLVDGDPASAWHEDASGDGEGEWIELRLAGNPAVNRLVLWNGDQDGDAASARPAELRIDLGDRTFTATLLEVDGPQAIDLPEVVEASSIRLTITALEGEGDAAMAEIEVRGPPPEGVAPED